MTIDSHFDRCNVNRLELESVRAHGGDGLIRFARILERASVMSHCNFIDVAELPAGASIGEHSHATSEEEFYLVLSGAGEMLRNDTTFHVEAGDLIRNPPGGTHSLRNTGAEPLKIFVFELGTRE